MFTAIRFTNEQLYPGSIHPRYDAELIERHLRAVLKRHGIDMNEIIPTDFVPYDTLLNLTEYYCKMYFNRTHKLDDAGSSCYFRGVPAAHLTHRHLSKLCMFIWEENHGKR